MIAHAKPKIVLLDDDTAFLDVAAYYLSKQFDNTAHIFKFNTSQNFLNHIHNHCYLPERMQDILHTFYNSDKSEIEIKQTLKDLSELPALLVLDHQLQGENTNGIAISKQVREYLPSSYIVLLTSQIDTHEALKLHNHNIIDLFIAKDDSNPMEDLAFHLYQQIERSKFDHGISTEDVFGFDTILENEQYLARRHELLNEIEYKSYLTISAGGDIALLDTSDQIRHYTFNNKVFSLND